MLYLWWLINFDVGTSPQTNPAGLREELSLQNAMTLPKHDATGIARRYSVTRRSIYSIKCGIYGIPIQLITFVDLLLYISSTYLDVYYFRLARTVQWRLTNMFQLKESEINVRLNAFKVCFMRSAAEIKAVPREKKENKLLKYLAK